MNQSLALGLHETIRDLLAITLALALIAAAVVIWALESVDNEPTYTIDPSTLHPGRCPRSWPHKPHVYTSKELGTYYCTAKPRRLLDNYEVIDRSVYYGETSKWD